MCSTVKYMLLTLYYGLSSLLSYLIAIFTITVGDLEIIVIITAMFITTFLHVFISLIEIAF
jgi:hypothetical protein